MAGHTILVNGLLANWSVRGSDDQRNFSLICSLCKNSQLINGERGGKYHVIWI